MRAVLQVHGPTTKSLRSLAPQTSAFEALAAEGIDGLVDLGIATSSKLHLHRTVQTCSNNVMPTSQRWNRKHLHSSQGLDKPRDHLNCGTLRALGTRSSHWEAIHGKTLASDTKMTSSWTPGPGTGEVLAPANHVHLGGHRGNKHNFCVG